MIYVSTRGQAPDLPFEDAMLSGLAADGGLYLPDHLPRMSEAEIAALAGLSYEETAIRVMRPFLGTAFDEATFAGLVERAYAGFGRTARAPLVQIGPNDWVMELFHGPTLAFKDFAMQLIGQMFDEVLTRQNRRVTIVVATSGDTGSAAIEAFAGRQAVDCMVMYPDGRISEVQRRQMTTPNAPNIHALAVQGTFDDCQARLKEMFADTAFRDRIGLAAVNSINWARVLAQVVYYFTAAVSLGAPHRPVSFCVPTGNFGDIYAGHVARGMGLPIADLVIATNENDILHRTLETGEYRKSGVEPTIAPSMDIQVSSNFERLLWELYGRDGAAVAAAMDELKATGGFRLPQGALDALRGGFSSGRSDKARTEETIRRVLAEGGFLLDPHTAIGVAVAEDNRGDPAIPMVTLGTAHPAKFPDAVEAASGIRPDLPPRMGDLYDRAERMHAVPNDLAAIEARIEELRR